MQEIRIDFHILSSRGTKRPYMLRKLLADSMKIHILLAISLIFISCQKREKIAVTENVSADTSASVSPQEIETDKDTILYDTIVIPDRNESLYTVKVLPTGTFHGDEVWTGADAEKWMGLFKGNDGFYIAKTDIGTRRVHDVVLDDANEKTGWEITATVKDTAILLISNWNYITEKAIISVNPEKSILLPGEKIDFTFNEKQYTLYAEGKAYKRDSETVYYNYKLYITANKSEKGTLLAALPSLDDNTPEILFIGDLDGDNLPDLILDTSGHYNASSPTLFLSKPAGSGKLLKAVAIHTSVGC